MNFEHGRDESRDEDNTPLSVRIGCWKRDRDTFIFIIYYLLFLKDTFHFSKILFKNERGPWDLGRLPCCFQALLCEELPRASYGEFQCVQRSGDSLLSYDGEVTETCSDMTERRVRNTTTPEPSRKVNTIDFAETPPDPPPVPPQ